MKDESLGPVILNSAAYSWWASWGPPTPHPELWSRRVAFNVKILFVIMALLFAGNISHSEDRPLLAGIVQVNGALLPFAEYKDQSWKATWVIEEAPEGSKSIALAKIPEKWTGYPFNVLSRWYLSSSDRHGAPLRVSQAIRVPMHCGELWGLETDFPKQVVAERTFPVKKAGVAFTSSQNFVGIKAVDGDSKILAKVSGFVQTTFDPLDREASKEYSEITKVSPMAVTRLLRTEMDLDHKRWYYVEAKRIYKKKAEASDYACPRISFLTGWVEETLPTGKLRFIQKHFFPTDCDMKAVQTDNPFGVLALNGQVYLFSQINGYEGETYRISTIDADGIHPVLEASGGGC